MISDYKKRMYSMEEKVHEIIIKISENDFNEINDVLYEEISQLFYLYSSFYLNKVINNDSCFTVFK